MSKCPSSCSLAKGLQTHFFLLLQSCLSYLGSWGFLLKCRLVFPPLPRPQPSRRALSPLPRQVLWTHAARNWWGVTPLVGRIPARPPGSAQFSALGFSHPSVLSEGSKSHSDVYSAFSPKIGVSCFPFFRMHHPTSPHQKELALPSRRLCSYCPA